jgi:CrcB protein
MVPASRRNYVRKEQGSFKAIGPEDAIVKGYLAVMIVGAFGCAARMWMSNFLAQRYGPAFPIGTLVVNILGCFIIGLFDGITRPDGGIFVSPLIRQAVMIGFLGGFTTFSSFGLQTMALFGDGEWGFAALNIFLSLFFCLLAVRIGQVIAWQAMRG